MEKSPPLEALLQQHAMFSHIMLGADDLEKSADATLGVTGCTRLCRSKGRIFYMTPTGVFAITKPIDGEAASCGNGSTIGFAMESPEQADAWHAAGLANGGTDCEDPPGVREGAGMKLYLAYLRDPSGNKLCAMYRMPKVFPRCRNPAGVAAAGLRTTRQKNSLFLRQPCVTSPDQPRRRACITGST